MNHMDASGTLTHAEWDDRIKGEVQHEDGLINIRVVWQLLAQSFFFSTYAILVSAKGDARDSLLGAQQELLIWAVPIAGMLAGVLASVSILASLYTIEDLRKAYEKYRKEIDPRDQSARVFPPMQGPDIARKWARIPPIGLPLVFILTWLIVLIRLITG